MSQATHDSPRSILSAVGEVRKHLPAQAPRELPPGGLVANVPSPGPHRLLLERTALSSLRLCQPKLPLQRNARADIATWPCTPRNKEVRPCRRRLRLLYRQVYPSKPNRLQSQ